MRDTALSPVERGILYILTAHDGPLTLAGFLTGHGLQVRKSHRLNLQERGLIEIARARPLALALTAKGWAWIEGELAGAMRSGAGGLGPLSAATAIVGRLLGRMGLPLREALAPASSPPPVRLPLPAEAVRAPEWIEVDETLARALQDISVFASALSRLRDAAKGSLEPEIKRAELSANLVFQNVRLAARKRALDLDGAVGSQASFDPTVFFSDEDIKLGAPVRIRKSPVTRGHGKKKVVIQPGLAEAV
jgi:hypothetical protein